MNQKGTRILVLRFTLFSNETPPPGESQGKAEAFPFEEQLFKKIPAKFEAEDELEDDSESESQEEETYSRPSFGFGGRGRGFSGYDGDLGQSV